MEENKAMWVVSTQSSYVIQPDPLLFSQKEYAIEYIIERITSEFYELQLSDPDDQREALERFIEYNNLKTTKWSKDICWADIDPLVRAQYCGDGCECYGLAGKEWILKRIFILK